MANERCLMLKAEDHNWGLISSTREDWSEVKWLVYYDGSYEIITTFGDRSKKEATGKMDEKTFAKLKKAIKQKPWRNPSIRVHACDGVAWQIESYSENGDIENTSGEVDYIYGHRVLETIVSLLPEDGNIYGSSAFVSVSRKD